MKRLSLMLLLLTGLIILLGRLQQTGRTQAPMLRVAVEPPIGTTDTTFTVAVKNFSWNELASVELSGSEHFEGAQAVLTAEGEPFIIGPRRRANVSFTPPALGFWNMQVDGQWLDGSTVVATTMVPVANAGSTTGVLQSGSEVDGVVRRQDEGGAIGLWLYEANANQTATFTVNWDLEEGEQGILAILDQEGQNLISDLDFIPNFTFPEDGSYIVGIGLFEGSDFTAYTLSATGPLRGDDDSGELALGGAAVGLIEPRTDLDSWQFDAEVGDVIAVGIRVPVGSNLDSALLLRDANGVILASSDAYDGSEEDLRLIPDGSQAGFVYVVPANGIYQIEVHSKNGLSSGPYRLLAAPAAAPPAASSLRVGQFAPGNKPADAAQAWQFEGSAGEEAVLQVEAQEAGFDPVLTLYGPDGSEVGSDDDGGGGLNPRLEVTLPADGIFTVVVGSYDGSGGAYSIRLSREGDATAEVAGDPKRGEALYFQTALPPNSAPRCATCHSVQVTDDPFQPSPVGPSHYGVATRAGEYVNDLSAAEYLMQSIISPDAYIVEGYQPGVMYQNYAEDLSREQIEDLVAFLMTLR